MKRRFNYTNRKKIEHSDCRIVLSKAGDVLQFDAELSLEKYGFADSAQVIVEGFYRTALMRFEFGRVDAVVRPQDRRLLDIDGDHASFRVKVVEEGHSQRKILGLADAIQPQEPEETGTSRRSLLPVSFEHMEGEFWRLNLYPRPVLEINKHVDGAREFVKSDQFKALVFPEIIRRVLSDMVSADIDPGSTDWRGDWFRFAGRFQPPPEDLEDEKATAEWCEAVARQFANHYRLAENMKV